VAKAEERYLVQALEFESVLRACLYRYARNISDVEELCRKPTQDFSPGASGEPEVRSVRAFSSPWHATWLSTGYDTNRSSDRAGGRHGGHGHLDEATRSTPSSTANQELMMLVKAVQELPERCRRYSRCGRSMVIPEGDRRKG